jgi:N-carbamoyl-L-amino-acid hydrolase
MVAIDGERLVSSLHEIRDFGRFGNGVVRRSLSQVDLDSREWLVRQLEDAGLEAGIDGIGTVFGRSQRPGRAILLGSHTDTEPRGGWLDGTLGVMYGLEIARSFAEDASLSDCAIDVASWIDEEGRFFLMLGSQSFVGALAPDMVEAAVDTDGVRLSDALADAGLAERPWVKLEVGRYLGYLEAHIEQGPYLEEWGKRIGVVTGIVGLRDYMVTVTGEANHAGTTPMAYRKDAGAVLISFAEATNALLRLKAGPATVWNIGWINFEPGSPATIPGRAQLILQLRDPEESKLDELATAVDALARERSGPVTIEFASQPDHGSAAKMDPSLVEHLAAAAEETAPENWVRMPSAAGHDAQVIAPHLPTAMLFVPSIGGISHDLREDTDESDIVLGCQTLASAAERVFRDALSARPSKSANAPAGTPNGANGR